MIGVCQPGQIAIMHEHFIVTAYTSVFFPSSSQTTPRPFIVMLFFFMRLGRYIILENNGKKSGVIRIRFRDLFGQKRQIIYFIFYMLDYPSIFMKMTFSFQQKRKQKMLLSLRSEVFLLWLQQSFLICWNCFILSTNTIHVDFRVIFEIICRLNISIRIKSTCMR